MAKVVIVGAGVIGLGAAMLLAQDGHDVTVFERDPAPPPSSAPDAWKVWERRGVNQFRLPHAFLARFRQIVDTELPQVSRALEAAGALRMNYVRSVLPETVTAGWRPGDESYELLTGRRSVIEAVLAAVAEDTAGVSIRRGTAVAALETGAPVVPGIPHVSGLRLQNGTIVRADLVVDVAGRRSALPAWLAEIGARRPSEKLEDSGFVYFGRHFRSADGTLPAHLGPGLMHIGTISSLSLPADKGTWSLGIVTTSADRALLALRDPTRWEAVVRSLPLVAHWLDGEPIDVGVKVMAKLEDRHRGFVIDGKPVATGVVAIGDSWACSNPANGRGASIGMMHAQVLQNQLRVVGLGDPKRFAEAFHSATAETVEPWYRATVAQDRHRLHEVEAAIRGDTYDPGDPLYEAEKALFAAGSRDPDCLRAGLDIRLVLRRPDEVFEDSALRERALEFGQGWREDTPPGPTRAELLSLVRS